MFKQFLRKYLRSNAGARRLQKIYQGGLEVVLTGMNYGCGGTYSESGELNVLRMVRDRYKGRKPIVIFDVGANTGGYAKAAAELLGDQAVIHCFEPSQKCFATFKETTQGIPNIVAHNIGFGEQPNRMPLYSDATDSGLASLYDRKLDHFGITMNVSEEIEISTLDEHCAEHGIEHIHFLKLDIEGHELSALKGARRMLDEDRVDMIQFEFGGCNIDSRTFFQDFYYLLKDKYTISRIVRDGLVEIPRYSEANEIFMTINYLAVHR
jgi:FkbM family methyltransferase